MVFYNIVWCVDMIIGLGVSLQEWTNYFVVSGQHFTCNEETGVWHVLNDALK